MLGGERYLAGFASNRAVLPMIGGQVTGLMVLALKPEVVLAASRQAAARGDLEDVDAIRPYMAGMMWDQDTGTSRGPIVSPDTYERLALPFLKKRLENLRSHGVQILMHNCGDNRPLMGMFIEAGVQCYQSLQPTANMELGPLVEQFGDRMTFWGGVPVELLVGGTPDEVRACVRAALEIGRRARGFILGPSHSVAYGTKYDNFMAMLDEYERLADRV
jgi:hypothetical protein